MTGKSPVQMQTFGLKYLLKTSTLTTLWCVIITILLSTTISMATRLVVIVGVMRLRRSLFKVMWPISDLPPHVMVVPEDLWPSGKRFPLELRGNDTANIRFA